MVFHEQLWMLVTASPAETFANIEIVYTVFRILLDPANLTPKEISEILENYLVTYFKVKNYEEKRTVMKNGIFKLCELFA